MTKEATLAALKLAREAVCPYIGATCDCKYGASGKGEQTGCPELRTLIAEYEEALRPTCKAPIAFAGPNAYPIACGAELPCKVHEGALVVLSENTRAKSTDP